jgi:hypothetical protein
VASRATSTSLGYVGQGSGISEAGDDNCDLALSTDRGVSRRHSGPVLAGVDADRYDRCIGGRTPDLGAGDLEGTYVGLTILNMISGVICAYAAAPPARRIGWAAAVS